MKVKLLKITPDIENFIVEIARVSSSRKDKTVEGDRLINYLIKHHHLSPFEHGFLTFEIETSRAIAAQLLRHRSNYFQEFSQRYQDVNKVSSGGIFENIELRKQAETNRQSSTEVFDPEIDEDFLTQYHEYKEASIVIEQFLYQAHLLYEGLLAAGVAKECARMILPLCTKTKLYITMNVRSVIHWLDLRDDQHAQKEIRDIATEVKKIVIKELPIISKARGYTV